MEQPTVHRVTCPVFVPDNVVLNIQDGAAVIGQGASDLVVGDGGSLVVEGSSTSTLDVKTGAGFECAEVVGASVVVEDSSLVDSGLCVASSAASVRLAGNTWVTTQVGTASLVDLLLSSVEGQPVVEGNSFTRVKLLISGGGVGSGVVPSVTGNTFAGLDQPAELCRVG